MATTSQCRTETLFYILELRLMNIKATHTHTQPHTAGALMQREQRDKVMESRNIIKSELFHPFTARQRKTDLLPVEQMHTVIQGERTWCFPC